MQPIPSECWVVQWEMPSDPDAEWNNEASFRSELSAYKYALRMAIRFKPLNFRVIRVADREKFVWFPQGSE